MTHPLNMRRIYILTWIAWIALSCCITRVDAADHTKRVLVLHSYHKGLGWTDSITQGIEAILPKHPHTVHIFYEFMDTKRIFDDAYLGKLADLYRHKYRNRRFDAIISSDDHAFRFLLDHHKTHFPETPVIFCGVNYFKDDLISHTPHFTGVVESFSIKGTIDAALTIDPEVRRLYVVVDNTVTGKANRKLIDAIAPSYSDRLQFEYVTDRDMQDVQKAVSNLPHDSVVLLLSFTSDRSGNVYSLEQSADIVSYASIRPVYSFWDFHLNHGVVGGMLTTGKAHGEEAAGMALRILNGEKPADIPVLKESPNRYIFDHVALEKFGITPDRLPPGSTIINQPLSFYQQYRTLVWEVVIAFAVLLSFSIALTFNLIRRRAAEADLKKSEDKFRALVETTSDWIWEVDSNLQYTYVSPNITDLLGFSPEEVLGKTPYDLMPPEEAQLAKSLSTNLWASEKPIIQLENIHRHKDGHDVILETTGMPFFDADGKFFGYRGIDRDITNRHKAEKALKESEVRFRDMAELLPVSIFEMDLDGELLYTNESGFSQFLYTQEDLDRGLNISALIDISDQAVLFDDIPRIVAGESIGLKEFSVVRKDGSRFPVISRSSAIHHDDRPVGIRGFMIDISERKRLEEQFQQAQRMESIGTLAGGIAHDFNNLLMGIHGRTQLIQTGQNPNARTAEHLKNIEEYVKSATQLTSQLLGFARAGKYDPKATDINRLIGKTIDMFGRTKKEIRIHKKLSGGLKPAMVDRTQIEQVLLNLFVNSWHAMPDGGSLTIETLNSTLSDSASRELNVTQGDYISIVVTDTGTGIDPQTQERIFEPFFSTKSRGRGTGLGLASAYGIIRNHNGAITVNSNLGQGTTFNLWLPATELEAQTENGYVENLTSGDETILLVDDEDMILSVGSEMLETLGYQVIIAKGGNVAVSIYSRKEHDIDLVILDLIMPDLSGKETYAQLKRIDPDVRVLLSSGYSLESEASEILEGGCDGFIKKPYDMIQLSKKIREILNGTTA